MNHKDRYNPFKEHNPSFILTQPLLTYGEKEFTLFKRLSPNKRLYSSQVVPTDRQAEEEILWRYQKEYYAINQQGFSYAEEAFDRRIQTQNPQQDFWQKVGSQTNLLIRKDSFLHSDTASTKSLSSNYGNFVDNQSKMPHSRKTVLKSPRQANRQQINKIRKTIQQFKSCQVLSKNSSHQQLSVMDVYKAKKGQDSFQPLFTFGAIQSTLQPQTPMATPQSPKTQANPSSPIKTAKLQLSLPTASTQSPRPRPPAQQTKQSPASQQVYYPKSIFIGKEQYFLVSLD